MGQKSHVSQFLIKHVASCSIPAEGGREMVSSAEQYGPRQATFNFGVCIRKWGLRLHSKKGCMCPGDPVLTAEKAVGGVAQSQSACLSKCEAQHHTTRLGGISYGPCSREVHTGESEVQCHSLLHHKIQSQPGLHRTLP